VARVLDAAIEVADRRRTRVPTATLNRVLAEAVARRPAPIAAGRRARLLYATQTAIEPPTFVLFASGARSVHFSYQRYLENRLRAAFDLSGTPVRLVFRERSRVELEPRRREPRARAGRPSGGSRAVSGSRR
jgi:GTP-binding protein